jgi:competence protein ComEC
MEEKPESTGGKDTALGWIVILLLLGLGVFFWFKVIPVYVNMFFVGDGATVSGGELDIPGDGTIPGRRPGEMAVVFFDVGFGDGILIQAPDNTTSLIDGGEGQNPQHDDVKAYDWAYELYLPFFKTVGIHRIDKLINTVPLSHYMGVQPDLIAHPLVEVKELYLTDYPATHFSYRRLKAEARNKVDLKKLSEGMELNFGPGVKGKVIFGKSDVRAPDDASHVIYLKYGQLSFLLMSHLTAEMEQKLIFKWGDSLDADVLKVGRHGDRDSTTEQLLSHVNPSYAVISTSTQNRLYAPNEDVIKRLQSAGVGRNNLLRTDYHGHIVFFTDGKSVRIKTSAFPFL